MDAAVDGRRRLGRLQQCLAGLSVHERRFLLAVMQLDSVPAAQRVTGWPQASPYYRLRLLLARLREGIEAG